MNSPRPEPLLEARQLTCERDERLLFEGLDFSLRSGQVLQVRGSNGTGKTTLLRIVCGLNDAFEGALSWLGQPLAECREAFRAELTYIGHRVGVNKVLTPVENLRWACRLRARIDDDSIYAALAQLGLRGFEESQCHTLSAGQQQRVSLARLLIYPTRLWILDEPFTTLDRQGVAQLEDCLQAHAQSGGMALVTTHHQLQIADLEVLELG